MTDFAQRQPAAATLREMRCIGAAYRRLPLSTVAEDEHAQRELRQELRSADRSLCDLRTELWQAQERSRRLATEVWRMDGERTRLRAVQGQLQAEFIALLRAARLPWRLAPRQAAPLEHSVACGEWETELRELVDAAIALRRAISEDRVLIEAGEVDAERAAWHAERDRMVAELRTLRLAASARERRLATERDAGARAARAAIAASEAAREAPPDVVWASTDEAAHTEAAWAAHFEGGDSHEHACA